MKTKAMSDVQRHINLLREKSFEKLTIYFSITVFFLLLIFIHRMSDIDWQDIYLLDIACIAVGLVMVTLRKKLSRNTIIFCYLVLGVTTAAVEFIGVGIAGMGDIAGLFCIMLSLFYLSRTTTVLIAIIITLIYSFAFYQYVYAGKALSENDMLYMSWSSSWVGTYIASAAFFVIIGISIYHLQTHMIGLLEEVEHQKKTISEQKQHIEHLANHDVLTGLPSSRVVDDCLDDVLQRATQGCYQSAVLFLDLDGFKTINDTHGHDAGDEVLKKVAKRISSVLRSTDTACRVGGDEFLLIIEKVEDQRDIEGLCQRLIKAIGLPLNYQDNEIMVGVSIGAVSYPDSATNARSLKLKADELMYQVKKSGKNNYQILMGSELLKSPMLAHG